MEKILTKKQSKAIAQALRLGTLNRIPDLKDAFEEYYGRLVDEAAILENSIKSMLPEALVISSRVKTIETTTEKLLRMPNMPLLQIWDLIGLRVIFDDSIRKQDQYAGLIQFGFGQFYPSSVNRRNDPRAGYRAIHVNLKLEGMRAEVQLRTLVQHIWADNYERFADKFGREIRYGSLELISLSEEVHNLARELQRFSLQDIRNFEEEFSEDQSSERFHKAHEVIILKLENFRLQIEEME